MSFHGCSVARDYEREPSIFEVQREVDKRMQAVRSADPKSYEEYRALDADAKRSRWPSRPRRGLRP